MSARELEVRVIVGGGAVVSGLAVASIWSPAADAIGWVIAFALTVLVAGRLAVEAAGEARLRWELRDAHLPPTPSEVAGYRAHGVAGAEEVAS